jgi:hypothetical protein
MTDQQRVQQVAARLLGTLRMPGESAVEYLGRITQRKTNRQLKAIYVGRRVYADYELELTLMDRFMRQMSPYASMLSFRGIRVLLTPDLDPNYAEVEELTN